MEKNSEANGAEKPVAQDGQQPKSIEDPLKDFPPGAVAGLLQACGSELSHVAKELKDLTEKQDDMILKIGEQNELFQSSPQLQELRELMEGMKTGMEKLSLVRQEMATIHDRSEKLKERAERLSGLRRAAERREEELVAQLDVGGDDEQDSVLVAPIVTEEGNNNSTQQQQQ